MTGTTDLVVSRDGLALRGEIRGDGPTVLTLHGLTATRRYVFHGSHTVANAGYRVVGYDARGHGESDPSPDPLAYRYADYADDAVAVLDTVGADGAVLVGHSMGAHTAIRVALLHPERVTALVIGAPAHLGRPSHNLDRWDGLAQALETDGPEGMFAAFGDLHVPPEWVESLRTVIIQRLSRHRHLTAVAAALRATPRSAAFDGMDALAGVAAPTLVVGSRDEIDPDHPLAVAQEYARRIPSAAFVVEEPGQAPLTWRGGALSRTVLEFLARV